MTNIDRAEQIIESLVCKGVCTFCVIPGGRCAPFVEVLSHAKNLEVLYFFDERSAGFFALGRAERDKKPVALVTTSGTALAELLPSAIESYYSGFPLVFLTADRPSLQGQKGCPQTLKNPLHIFKGYVQDSFSLSHKENCDLQSWIPCKGSLHLNVSFDKPLLDKESSSVSFRPSAPASIYPSNISLDKPVRLGEFFKKSQKPILLLGGLREEEQEPVQEFLKDYKGFVYAEPLSNISCCRNRLFSGEKILSYGIKHHFFDGVIRFGSLPRCLFWKDLENESLPVLNFSSPPFYPGISRESFNFPLKEGLPLLKEHTTSLSPADPELRDYDKQQFKKWQNILKSYPQSEPYWVQVLKQSLPDSSSVFLGNSLPIRLWDLVSLPKKHFQVRGQSGVNGIDGLISRFLGGLDSSKNHFALIGDLSALYDFSGLWSSQKEIPFRLIIMNNFGGQIFSQLFSNPSFLNPHSLDFSPVAKMWGLDYERFESPSTFGLTQGKKPLLMEIRPDGVSTKECLKTYQSLWETD